MGDNMNILQLLLIIFICTNILQAERRVIDFSKSPFENTRESEKWSSGGWYYDHATKYISSSKGAADNSICSVTFQFKSEKGKLVIRWGVDCEEKYDFLKILLGDKQIFRRSGGKLKGLFETELEKGMHTLKFVYYKDSHTSFGSDQAYIYSISYESSTINEQLSNKTSPIEFLDLQLQDEKTVSSWGNGDKIANTFETVFVYIGISITSNYISVDVDLPNGIFLVQYPEIKNNHLVFAIFCSPSFSGSQIQLEVKHPSTTKKYTIPFESIDYAKMHLSKEEILTSKKFDYQSKEQLDNFLTKFPDSDFAPVIFTFRLECCREVKRRILSVNKAIQDEDKKQKNLVLAINEYLLFIEKYPNRMLTQIAIQECFELYTRINRISFYKNFIERFPHNVQSIIAKQYIQILFYKVVCAKNTVDAYDYFIQIYPTNSFLTQKCIQLARQKLKLDTLKQLTSLITQMKQDPMASNPNFRSLFVKNIQNDLAMKFMLEWSRCRALLKKDNQNKFFLGEKMLRAKNILESIFANTNARISLMHMESIDEVIHLNEKILERQKKNHKSIIDELDKRFTKLEKTLDENFKKTQQQMSDLQKSVQHIHIKLKWMHDDLAQKIKTLDDKIDTGFDGINDNLKRMEKNIVNKIDAGFDEINQSLKDMEQNITAKITTDFDKINKYQQLMHNDLKEMNKNVITMNTNILDIKESNKKFLKQNAKILQQVQENGKILTGWQQYQEEHELKIAVGSTVANALKLGVESIPVVGPITAEITAPVLDFLGEKTTGLAISLWETVF